MKTLVTLLAYVTATCPSLSKEKKTQKETIVKGLILVLNNLVTLTRSTTE